ncbi:MAG: aminotransferase class IV [candidate division Zixibacteria bacterium]|nr:aminotransferase class IV [candidate division Zixibacteria bacterium]MBU1470260.1 aminotransferase class IV [candidate division Zixibacteria bacterium]MBU2626422.1 aminotransferase class IV [candidate division Zixibacteria bacterium]
MKNRMLAYFEGRIVPEERAQISIKTHAFNYGTCAFEGMKAFHLGDQKWNLFRIDDHVRRLLRTCGIMHIEPPATYDEITDSIKELVLKNGLDSDIYIRPMIYCSLQGVGLGKLSPTELAIFCLPVDRVRHKVFRTRFSKTVRIPPEAIPSHGKITGMYVNSFIAQREVAEQGDEIALMKSIDGYVTEAFGMNLFVVKKNRCITSPVSIGVLDGITRRSIMKFCVEDLGMTVEERLYTPRFLHNADEIFICGTGAGVNSVISVDGRNIGNGNRGEVTRKLFKLYWSVIHADNSDYNSWYNVISRR